jgi:DNA-binding NarL/FixJ family response regulator
MLTAFILYDHSLFARGLERLLEQVGGVQVTGLAGRGEEAFAQVKALKPDVVVVEAGRGESEPEMLLSRLLVERCRAMVVRLNLEDNNCVCYSGCRCTVNSVEDLVKCVVSTMTPQPWMGSQPCSYANAEEARSSTKGA